MGEEVAGSDVDDPWPKHKSGSSGSQDLAEPLSTVVLDETLPIGAHDLWRLVMGEPDFQSSVRELNKQRDSKTGRWHLTKGASTAAKNSQSILHAKHMLPFILILSLILCALRVASYLVMQGRRYCSTSHRGGFHGV